MGKRTTSQEQTQNQTGTQQTTFAPRTPQEQQILDQLQGLGGDQLKFLTGLLNGTTSPFALNQADQAQLDRSYQSAFDRANQEGKDYADYLATTRGMTKGSTPVSQQALDRYGMVMSDLNSQKANAALQMGLQGTGMRLQGTQMAPIGLSMAFNPYQQERLASGVTNTSGSGHGYTTSVYRPSLMDNIGQGMGLGLQAMQLGAGLGGLGMPGMGGLTTMFKPS